MTGPRLRLFSLFILLGLTVLLFFSHCICVLCGCRLFSVLSLCFVSLLSSCVPVLLPSLRFPPYFPSAPASLTRPSSQFSSQHALLFLRIATLTCASPSSLQLHLVPSLVEFVRSLVESFLRCLLCLPVPAVDSENNHIC